MKIRIKTYNGELPSYLTVGKVYETHNLNHKTLFGLITDDGRKMIAVLDNSSHLNGGEWEVVE